MKHIIFVAGLALSAVYPAQAADAPAKAEKTCIKTTDAKTGKEVEKCKVMKKHEKKEGHKVEGTKPDKK